MSLLLGWGAYARDKNTSARLCTKNVGGGGGGLCARGGGGYLLDTMVLAVMFLKLHIDLQAYTLQSSNVLLRHLTITMSKSINAVTIYLKLNTLSPRQIVERNVEFGLFLKVSYIYLCQLDCTSIISIAILT